MHTRPVELVAQRSEDLELDPVLGTAGGALHPDQVLQRCDPDDQAISKLDRLSMRLEVIESGYAGGSAEDVQVNRCRW